VGRKEELVDIIKTRLTAVTNSLQDKEMRLRTSDPRSLAGRPLEKSKRLGQVFTPEPIAARLVRQLLAKRPDRPVNILDPCVGPQTFPKQILQAGLYRPGDKLTLVDLDDEMTVSSKRWVAASDCKAKVLKGDYLDLWMDGRYDYAVLNPPYLRQEWLERKEAYQEAFKQRYGLKIPGTSNLYVYFIVKVLKDLKPGGSFACIVYDSWQFTKYGRWLRDLIEESCVNIQVVPVHDQPFDGRLIDATLIFARKKQSHEPSDGEAKATREGKALSGCLSDVKGFSPLGKVYQAKRGLRLKQADFFLCDISSYAELGATLFVKKIAKVAGYAVPDSHPEAALLLQTALDNPSVLSELERRLSSARHNPQDNESILTWYRERPDSWMLHQTAPHAPILFNYYIRKRPRHIFNPTRAYSDNFYGLLMPQGISAFAVLASLNSTAVCAEILAGARNQGSGLAKIQLFEYRGIHVPDLTTCDKSDLLALEALGRELVDAPDRAEHTILLIDQLLADIFNDPRLEPGVVKESFARADRKARRPKEA